MDFGKYGRMRLRYLKSKKRGLYSCLLLQDELYAHLKEIEDTARAWVEHIVEELAKTRGVTEELKVADQM